MIRPPETFGKVVGPDGMAFDRDGYLYVALLQQGDITILSPDGILSERISLGEGIFPTNVAFALTNEPWYVVTEGYHNSLVKIDAQQPCLPLCAGRSN